MSVAVSGTRRISNEALYRELRRRIIHLELPPHARLTEQSIAAEFELSRTPVRRVFDRLANDGLVTISAGSGASVSAVDFQALREVWALRVKIVELIGDFVLLPAPAEVQERLRDCLDEARAVGSITALAHLYDEFHDTMLDLLTNGPLRKIYDQLYAQTARAFVQMLPSLDFETELDAVRDEIARTIEACTHRSGRQLAAVRGEHMHHFVARISKALVIAPPAGIASGNAGGNAGGMEGGH